MDTKRGRPKGRSQDSRSFGPLGDLIRKARLDQGLGLSDVAAACGCSVQFISNIEHGRAPLPWDKAQHVAEFLKLSLDEVQVANLAIRSDFRSFVSASSGLKGKRMVKPAVLKNLHGAASTIALAARDDQLQEVIQKYQSASSTSKRRFVKAALELLTHT